MPSETVFHRQQFEPDCPFCGVRLNGIGSDHGAMPDAGDFSLCLHCGEPLVFTKILGEIGLRKPKPRERKEALAEPLIAQARLNVLAIKGGGGTA